MKNYCEWCHQADDWSCPKINVTPKTGSQVYCSGCGREILLVMITRAAQIAGVSKQTIYYWITKNWVSIVPNAAGHKRIYYSSMYQPPKPKTEDEEYVDALSERAKGSGLKIYRGRAA